MNQQLKAVLLTVLTLSCFVIALVELSGVSSTALFNKYGVGKGDGSNGLMPAQSLSRDKQVAAMPKTTIYFYETKHNFGELKEGDVVKYAYRFKNTGTNPLMISKVDVTCGCTVPTFSKEPIQPGGEGEIMIQYNSAHHPGHQQKNALIHSNAQEEAISIGFEAEVKDK
jgi:hypothetical protein